MLFQELTNDAWAELMKLNGGRFKRQYNGMSGGGMNGGGGMHGGGGVVNGGGGPGTVNGGGIGVVGGTGGGPPTFPGLGTSGGGAGLPPGCSEYFWLHFTCIFFLFVVFALFAASQ